MPERGLEAYLGEWRALVRGKGGKETRGWRALAFSRHASDIYVYRSFLRLVEPGYRIAANPLALIARQLAQPAAVHLE